VCPIAPATLLPGQTIVCTASYTVVAADLTGQALSNTATVSATPPGGDPVTSDPSTARIIGVVVWSVRPRRNSPIRWSGRHLKSSATRLAVTWRGDCNAKSSQ
jgi:hypothetical protein